MSRFVESKIELPHEVVGEPKTVLFRIANARDYDAVRTVHLSCGCMGYNYNRSTGEIQIKYKPNPIPTHLRNEGKHSYHSDKYIEVSYRDGTSEILTISVTVYDK